MSQHSLPDLPYSSDALAPHIIEEILDYHYGNHHATYVDKLNALLPGTEFENANLEEIIKKASGSIFNNRAQVWNHTFYWHCLSPNGGGEPPTGKLADAINKTFGDFSTFKQKFSDSVVNNFGSGWTWLVKNAAGELEIVNTSNSANPITIGHTPVMTCDVWEHAYYLDYRNARPKYLESFWALVNWDFVAETMIYR
jgi:Fe-Mn family superoxide dismutase